MGRKTISDPEELAQVNVRMTKDFKKQCDEVAESEGISLNEWIRRAMRDRLYLENGKDITPDVVELPPVYREAVNKAVSARSSEIENKIDTIQEQINKMQQTSIFGSFAMRKYAVDWIAHNYINDFKGKLKSTSIIFRGEHGNNEGEVIIHSHDEIEGKTEFHKNISSDEIDIAINEHGDEIFTESKDFDDELARSGVFQPIKKTRK
ncbi:MAG: toxin-antitoxin system HicB family antitoxin [Methanocorpusculum sp.]|nr:toxin-antitoxin system HicB family antitoxin [Methanocorpusculum sp.]